MSTKPVGPPEALLVSVAEAKLNMRIDHAFLDTLVEAWLKGVIAHAENYTRRSFIARTWRLTMDGFPDGAIELERPPLMEVAHIKYYDASGAQQTISPSDYVVDTASEPGRVVPAAGKVWPQTADRFSAIEVEYRCGYGIDPSAVPDDVRLYVLAKLQEQFDPATKPEKDTVQSSYIDELIFQYRIF